MSSDNIIKKTVNQLLRTAGVDTPSQIPVVNNTTTFSTFSPTEYRNLIKGKTNQSASGGSPLDDMFNALRNNTSEFENWQREIEELKELTPEIDDAADITISSIFSPTDMQTSNIRVVTGNTGLGESTESEINRVLTDHFNDQFNLAERAFEWAKTARFGTGATGIFLMPAANIRTLNSLSDAKAKGIYSEGTKFNSDIQIGHESLSMERFNSDIESSIESWVTGSSEALEAIYDDIDQKIMASSESMMSEVAADVNAARKRKNLTELTNSQVVHGKDLAKAIRNLFIDNKSVRFHSDVTIFEKSMQQTGKAIDAITKRAMERVFGRGENRLYAIDADFDPSKDNCVVIELDGSTVLPITIPNNPSKMIGCIALVDQWGNPLNRQFADDYFRNGSRTLNEANARALNAKSLASEFASDVSDRQKFNIASNMFTTAMKLMIQTKLNEYGLGHVDIEEHHALGSCLFNYLLKDNKIGMVFIPASFMVYFAYDYHANGTGKSLIEGISTIIALRNTLTMAGIMASAENSVNNRTIEVSVDEKNANPLQTLELVRNMYIDKKVVKLNHNPMDIQRGLYNKSLTLVPKNMRGLKDSLNTTVEHRSTGAIQPDEQLREMLTRWIIAKLKVPHNALADSNQNEFARAIVLTNLMFNNKIHILQQKTEQHLSKFVKIYTSFSSELITELKTIVKGVKASDAKVDTGSGAINDSLKGKLDFNDDTTVDKFVDTIIANMVVELPRPRAVVDKAQYTEISEYVQTVEKMIDDIYPDDMVYDPDYREVFKLRKAKAKSDLVRQVINEIGFQSNYVIPKIEEIDIDHQEVLYRILINDQRKLNAVRKLFADRLNSADGDGSNIKPYGDETKPDTDVNDESSDPNDEFGGMFGDEPENEAPATGPIETGGTPEGTPEQPEGNPAEGNPEPGVRRRTPPEELTFPDDDAANPPGI